MKPNSQIVLQILEGRSSCVKKKKNKKPSKDVGPVNNTGAIFRLFFMAPQACLHLGSLIKSYSREHMSIN